MEDPVKREAIISHIRITVWMLGMIFYIFTPIRRYLTEKTWEGFVMDFNDPAIFQQLFSVPPFNAGDSGSFLNYHHFVSSLRVSDWEFVDISSKLKVIFIIEVVSLVVYMYVVMTIIFCFVVIGDMISVNH